MNQRALVLAADSAVTVTSFVNGQKMEKYYKSANKIFELSELDPVALMMFNEVALHAVPWELLIKEYRAARKGVSFATVVEYLQDLLAYVSNHPTLFPMSRQEEHFRLLARRAGWEIMERIERQPAVTAAPDATSKNAARLDELRAESARMLGLAVPGHFSALLSGPVLAALRPVLEADAHSDVTMASLPYPPADLSTLAVDAVLREYDRYLPHTGLVVAGFGTTEAFPGYVPCEVRGLVLGVLVVDFEPEERVTLDVLSRMRGFAQNDMVDTFMLGCGRALRLVMLGNLYETMQEFEDEARKVAPSLPGLTTERELLLTKFNQKFIDASVEAHLRPLAEAVAILSPDELANLAETLVSLESLKERVTKPSEQIGGPIDVAVVTKGEGLVWVKRKHYFPGELNARFFERQRKRMA